MVTTLLLVNQQFSSHIGLINSLVILTTLKLCNIQNIPTLLFLYDNYVNVTLASVIVRQQHFDFVKQYILSGPE